MGEISGSLCISLIFAKEEDVDLRRLFLSTQKLKGVFVIAIEIGGIILCLNKS